MNVMGALGPIINREIEAPGDYWSEDGLLYCGKCHTPKQTHGSGPLAGHRLPIPCACQTEAAQVEKEQEARKKTEDLRERCLPGKGMRGHTFETASETKHIQIARRYVEKWEEIRERNIGLLFWGNTGTGKSFAAHCIANALIDRGISVRLFSTVDLITRLMDRETRDRAMELVTTVPLLILDDVGAERDTPFAREQLCAVIETRSESQLPLIVTTNYSVEKMKTSSDPAMQRIFDRLDALCVRIAVTGESRRREIREQKMREARSLLGV